jgi:hypothetical protein
MFLRHVTWIVVLRFGPSRVKCGELISTDHCGANLPPSFARPVVSVSGVMAATVLTNLSALVVAAYAPPRLLVYDTKTRALVRTVGTAGSGSTVGAVAQLTAPRWLSPSPWSNTTVLVPDLGGGRIVEVDVVTGILVKVWLSGLANPLGVAATPSRMAVAWGIDTATTKLVVYDLAGTVLWSVGGASLGDQVTSNSGMQLGGPARVQFSQDGTYVLVAEAYSNRVTKWNAATGAFIGSLGAGLYKPYDVMECWTGSGAGALATAYLSPTGRLDRLSEVGALTSMSVTGSDRAVSAAVLPGIGVVVVSQGAGLFVYSSVAVATHPVSATATTATSTATFTVALTANSATTGLTYAWTKAGVPVGTSSPSYTYTATTADVDAGPTYAIVCTITHATGYAVTNAATLTVVRGVTIAPLALNALVGGPGVTFTATPATGNTVSVYAWTLGGVAVGTNAPTYTYTAVDSQAGQTLNVVCTVTGTNGTAGSNTATVTVQVRNNLWSFSFVGIHLMV